MALVLDATVKGANANSYVTQAEADTYFDGRLNASAWTGAGSGAGAAREQALVAATTRLEQETYYGYKTTTTQRLKWPRSGVDDEDGSTYSADVIPRCVKEACFEMALALLQDSKQLDATGLAGFENVRVGPLSVTIKHPEPNGKLPAQVQRLLSGVMIGGAGTVGLVRA